MKIQLDTTNKTIKVESNVKLSDLVETLDKLLPNNEWKEFELQTNVTISSWTEPIIVERYKPEPVYPWYCRKPQITNYGTNLCNHHLKAGTYNIEC